MIPGEVAAQDDAAVEALDREIDRYEVLTTPAGRELQALVELAAQVLDVPNAAINLITGTNQHQIATTGIEPSVCSREDSMCGAVISEPEPVVVPDARQDPRFAENPFVTGVIGTVRFYASAPLVTPSGTALGRLCVFDERPREVTPRQQQALVTLAARVMDVLELRLKSRQVEQSLVELTRAQDELRRSNEALLHFAGQVSHDLRNPLMAIRANAELLATEPAVENDPEVLAVVARITESCQEMEGMIRQVLASARDGGRLRPGWADLRSVVDRALRDLGPQLRSSGGKVDVGELPRVPGDPELLYAVAANLLNNALKFRRPGVPPVVRVDAERRGDRWRVRVQDNGIGVPAGQEKSVFMPYVRARPAAPGEGPAGHGIGLATVHRAVRAHGGQVGLEAAPGGGTTVWFELPAEAPDEPQQS